MEKAHHIYTCDQPFKLECGRVLPKIELHYTTSGNLNKDNTNVVWVCHALTGNSDFTTWWGDLFSKDAVFNTNDYFIICANMLGSCYGSTGPLSINPESGKPYFHDFPEVTNRDVVRAFDQLRQHLGLNKIHTLLGGSLGGQQAIEWAVLQPEVFNQIIPMACNAWHSAWGIAFNEAQRMAIQADQSWRDYQENAGQDGLKAARAIGMLSYRHYLTFEKTQSETDLSKTDNYKASSYLQYQGEKLIKRFNAFSYWLLSKMMDSHHVGRNRNNATTALGTIKAKTLIIGIDTDILFPVFEQQYLADHIPESKLSIIQSQYGHDGFLVEFEQINSVIKDHVENKSRVL